MQTLLVRNLNQVSEKLANNALYLYKFKDSKSMESYILCIQPLNSSAAQLVSCKSANLKRNHIRAVASCCYMFTVYSSLLSAPPAKPK